VIEQLWRCTWRPWLTEIGGVLGGGRSGDGRVGRRRDSSCYSIHWLTHIGGNVESGVHHCLPRDKRWEMRDWLGVWDIRSWDDTVLGVCCTRCLQYSVYPVLGVCRTCSMQYSVNAVLGVCCTRCMLYSVYAVLGVCCTRCMLYWVYAVLGVCWTGCMLYSVYAVLGLCCTRCMLYLVSTHDCCIER